MNRQKLFRKLFRFREDIRSHSSKIWCGGNPNFFFRYGSFQSFKLLLFDVLSHSNTFFAWLFLQSLWEALKVFKKCRKSLRNHFCLFIWGPGRIFKAKKLSKISWHCSFKLWWLPKIESARWRLIGSAPDYWGSGLGFESSISHSGKLWGQTESLCTYTVL